MPDDVSLRTLAEIIVDLDAFVRQSARHWVSPYFDLERTGFSKKADTKTEIQILNPGAAPIDLEVRFFGRSGAQISELTKRIGGLGPGSMERFSVGEESSLSTALGSVEIIGSGPLFPAGNISMDRTKTTNVAGVEAPSQTVAFAMHFYPVRDL